MKFITFNSFAIFLTILAGLMFYLEHPAWFVPLVIAILFKIGPTKDE